MKVHDRVSDLINNQDLQSVHQWLLQTAPLDIAEQLSRLETNEKAVVFRLLPKDRALSVFEALEPVHQQELLASLREPNVREIFEAMDPDDRTKLLDEMPAGVAKKLLDGLSPKERRLTSILLGYPKDSVGRIMSPEFVDLRVSYTVAQAIERVRRYGREAETIYALPVTDEQLHLVGIVSLRDLVLANQAAPIGSIMKRELYSVQADEDQEKPARLMREADLIALPVTDREGRLLGVLTFDDAMAVLEAEETEDILRGGGAEPPGRPYLSVSIWRLARTRLTWLFILILAATMTVNVLSYFEETLQAVITLSLFIPLLIDTGGNIGAQSATMVIRAMAVGEVRFNDLSQVVLREIQVGLMLGLMLGVIGFLPVMLFFGKEIALVISISLTFTSTFAALAGSMLPMLASRVGVDPAVVSAPIITTLVDASGLIIYFLTASFVLGL
jgi:magnesium transporter